MKNIGKMKVSTLAMLLASVVFIAFTPLAFHGYSLMVVNISLIYTITVFGISIMLGMGGQLSFAGLAFMGLGAYCTANLTSNRLGVALPTALSLPLSVIACSVIAFLIGLLLLKLKGTYFTFSTIALVQVCYSFFNNYRPLFGGPDGISGIPTLSVGSLVMNTNEKWFYALVVILIVMALFVERIRRTKFGRQLASVRDNDTAALTLGVNVYMVKVLAFTVSGALGALAGSLYAMHGNFVSSDLFTYNNATQFIIMAMVGGINSTFGAIVGSVFITILPEVFRSLERYLQLVYGVAVILLMVFMPMGLAGMCSDIGHKIRRSLGMDKKLDSLRRGVPK